MHTQTQSLLRHISTRVPSHPQRAYRSLLWLDAWASAREFTARQEWLWEGPRACALVFTAAYLVCHVECLLVVPLPCLHLYLAALDSPPCPVFPLLSMLMWHIAHPCALACSGFICYLCTRVCVQPCTATTRLTAFASPFARFRLAMSKSCLDSRTRCRWRSFKPAPLPHTHAFPCIPALTGAWLSSLLISFSFYCTFLVWCN